MRRSNTLSLTTVALGIAIGGLSLSVAGCGGAAKQAAAEAKSCGAGNCGGKSADKGAEKSCGGESKQADKGGEKSCGAGSCG